MWAHPFINVRSDERDFAWCGDEWTRLAVAHLLWVILASRADFGGRCPKSWRDAHNKAPVRTIGRKPSAATRKGDAQQ